MRYSIATIHPKLGRLSLVCSVYIQVGEQFEKQNMEEVQNENLNSLLKYEPLKTDRSYLPWYIRKSLDTADIYTDFVLNFLMRKRNGTGKIDILVLKRNSIDCSVKYFFENENSVKFGYVDIVKKTEKFLILKINDYGISTYNNNCVKYKINVPTHITRVSLWILKLTRKSTSLVFVSAPKYIKIAMESGIAKLILFIIAVIGLLLKWEEIKTLIHKLTEK